MIDWEDAFDLSALTAQVKDESGENFDRRSGELLARLQRKGLMDFELLEEAEQNGGAYPAEDTDDPTTIPDTDYAMNDALQHK